MNRNTKLIRKNVMEVLSKLIFVIFVLIVFIELFYKSKLQTDSDYKILSQELGVGATDVN